MRPIFRNVTLNVLAVVTMLLLAGTFAVAGYAGAPVIQQDTSEAVYMRIFRDSVKNAEGAYQQVEARVTAGEIISVHVAGKEIPETEYEVYTARLTEILTKEKELKNELFSLMNRITEKKKKLDSLLQEPLSYNGEFFYPDQDLREQILDFLVNESTEHVSPQDSLPANEEIPEQEKFMKIMNELQQIRVVRDENIAMLKETIRMLDQEEKGLREQIEEINDLFTTEKISFTDDQKKQNAEQKKKKKKKSKRKRKKSRKDKKTKAMVK